MHSNRSRSIHQRRQGLRQPETPPRTEGPPSISTPTHRPIKLNMHGLHYKQDGCSCQKHPSGCGANVPVGTFVHFQLCNVERRRRGTIERLAVYAGSCRIGFVGFGKRVLYKSLVSTSAVLASKKGDGTGIIWLQSEPHADEEMTDEYSSGEEEWDFECGPVPKTPTPIPNDFATYPFPDLVL
ncbi:hypothetical protein HDU79_002364 [Rhizoclosmatium sp. JEL0117]|nr:hypothetical protein HDU79_002364 [Rhizoclosmatium sp. JEL0117]